MAAEEYKSRFLSNTMFSYSFNIMATLTNGLKMHKQNVTVSVGLFL